MPTDIIQLFGTGSVPVLVAGTVYGVFELGENLASQRAKEALSKWLLTFDVHKSEALPEGTQELFERIFGERHFSLKCFVRSAAFSVGSMALIGIILFLISPAEAITNIIFPGWRAGQWLTVQIWLPWSIFIDYVSLFKTRLILRFVNNRRNTAVAVAIMCIDYLVYRLIF